MLLFLGSTEDTRRILEFWLRLFCMETWEGEVVREEDRGEESDPWDLWDSELQELPPEDPRPSLI